MRNLGDHLIEKRENYKNLSKLLGYYSVNFKRISEMDDKDLVNIIPDDVTIFKMGEIHNIIRYKGKDGIITFTCEPIKMKSFEEDGE